MYQVPQAVWKEIGQDQKMKSPRNQKLFQMNPDDRDRALAEEVQQLVSTGIDKTVAAAYQKVLPLLQENQAISRYILKHDRTDLRAALPEVLSVDEAVMLMQQDFLLDARKTSQLKSLLNRLS